MSEQPWDYNPDPAIDAELREEALAVEMLDLSLGYPARWWLCPDCHAAHRRGFFMSFGVHRCLGCGYQGERGTMHTNDPRPPAETEGTRG